MIGSRIPHTICRDNRRLTLLDCGVCGCTGHFVITRVVLASGKRAFACDACRAKHGEAA